MPRSRRTSGQSDHTSAADAPSFQPPGRHEVGHRGRRIPDGLRILAPSTEPVDGEAAGRNEAREKCGHESGDRARAMYLRSPTRGPRPSQGRRFAMDRCRGERGPLDGSGPGGPERRQAWCCTLWCPRALPCRADPSRLADAGFCRMEGNDGAGRGGRRGSHSRRRRVVGSGALSAFSLGWWRRGHRRRLARSRPGLFGRGALGGRGLSVGLGFLGGLGGRDPGW
ncbi:hypothetical protein BH18ACT14_BH18ACT14_03210 [soil metagenome]